MPTIPFDDFISPMSFQYPEAITQSGWLEHGPFAAWVVEATEPQLLVELGTHWGYSFFAFCQAVQTLELKTRCVAVDTWAGDEHAGYYDNAVFESVAATTEGRYATFATLLRRRFDEAVDSFADSSIDLLHIDGRHFYEDARQDFELYLPKLSSRAVVLIHDVTERQEGFGVWKLWEELQVLYPTFTFAHGHGLGVAAVGTNPPDGIQRLTALPRDGAVARFVRSAYHQLGKAISGSDGMSRAETLERLLNDAGSRHAAEMTTALAAVSRLEEEVVHLRRANEAMARQAEGREAALRAGVRRSESMVRAGSRPTARRFAGMLRGELRRAGERLLGSEAPDEAMTALLGDLFDAEYYRGQHPELRLSNAALFAHYLREGWPCGESPSPLFDADWYLQQNPDVQAAGVMAIQHYLMSGDREGRDPNAVFDTSWYRLHHPHELSDLDNALVHFVKHGDSLGYDPSPAFLTTWYRSKNPDAALDQPALSHYLTIGALRGRDPHPDFDTAWYVVTNPDICTGSQNPLVHYLTHGLDEGRASSASGAQLCRN